jgi:kynurenine formamidase
MPDSDSAHVSTAEFRELFRSLSAWGRWGELDERGALNYITVDRVAEAARLVSRGITVSLSWPLDTDAAAHNPSPAQHRMTSLAPADDAGGAVQLAKDWVGIDYHSDTHTHIDALCHVAYAGSLYNGTSTDVVTPLGATAQTVEAAKDGLVGRGVLLDIPRVRGVPWLEPGEPIYRDDLEAAELGQGVRVQEGDILLVRTGHARRLKEVGSWETANAKAGLHPTAMPFLAERRVAALGSDGNSDTAPGSTDDVDFPIHVLAINAMGIHLLDYLQLEDLADVCERERRWTFFLVAAPLRIAGGTGSPLNPIAIF